MKRIIEYTRGQTYKQKTSYGTVYVTINTLHDEPYEVFVHCGKPGSDIYALVEGYGRLISLALRSAVYPSATLHEVIAQLRDLGGIRSYEEFKSIPDTIAKLLEEYVNGQD